MALRLRRGTDSERALITPADGELVYTTDTKRLYIGDGTTAGGNPVDTAGTQFGANLNMNGFDLVGTGNINTTGNLTVTGNITADGNLTLGGNLQIGDATTDTVSILAKVESHVLPDVDGARNLGSSTNKFNQVWANTVHVSSDVNAASVNANIVADDSTILLNVASGVLNASGTLKGTVKADDNTTFYDSGTKEVTAGAGTFAGTVQAPTFTGTLTGDVKGSLFADDSTVLVDGVNGTLSNGKVTIRNNQIELVGVAELLLGKTTDTVGQKIRITNTDGSSPLEQIVLGKASVGDVSKSTFASYHGSMTSPVQATDGDWIGAFNSEVWDPGTSNWVASSLIAFRCDNNETVGADTAKGKIAFINNAGTNSAPSLKAMSVDARGFVAINNTVDYIATAALDVTGDAVVSGYTRFGNLTTVQRDALTPAAGMIIYNTTDNKFQGRTGTAWVDLH
tara:strand:+ start:5511 stop:6869 length:1359 start_codon:yes stop_codon:yes gene_type:complete